MDACNRGAAVEADAIGEQQPKWTRSGAAAQADASGERAAAAEAGAIQEHSWKRTQTGAAVEEMQSGSGAAADCKRRAAAEADAIGGASSRNRGAAALHKELSGTRLLTVGE